MGAERKIRGDVLQALADWKAGKPVRSVELGHVHRTIENPGGSPRIDVENHYHQDQDRAYAYCFHLIELFSLNGVPSKHEDFAGACDAYEELFREIDENAGMTDEERDGAESLAWKALQFGWARAIEGHKDSQYIEVRNPNAEAVSAT